MKKLKRGLYLVLLLSFCKLNLIGSSASGADTHSQRVDFANSFANIVLSVISDQKKSYEKRKEVLSEAFSKSVDIDWIAKFVIGRNWNNATDEQREKYISLYRQFLTKTYVENFAQNPDKSISGIKILNVNDKSEEDFTVATEMKLTNQDVLNVSYLVYEKDGHYKVHDIAIENVSLINSHRSEFTSLAASQGLDGVIKKLEHLVSSAPPEVAISMK